MTAGVGQTAAELRQQLQLSPHPEGGHYRRIYASDLKFGDGSGGAEAALRSGRPHTTAIHFLLESGQVSRLHRLRSDELWFFHAGRPLQIVTLDPHTYAARSYELGPDVLFCCIPAGVWFGARHTDDATDRQTRDQTECDYSLVSCVVAPGFTFDEWQLATSDLLDDDRFALLARPLQSALRRLVIC